MADGEVKIDTKLDTDGIDTGLKELKSKLNNLGAETEKSTKKEKAFNEELDKTAGTAEKAGKEVDKAAKKSKNLGDIINTVKNKINTSTVAGIAAAATIKKTVDALNDCAAAYRTQANAENALQIAAKNNPYLNEESVYNLRNFASALQGMSEIGDEVSLQVMAQLAATGRNEEQIMAIMSAAADMAAVTGQDIASAAQQLNATLNGNAGTLGRQIGEINNLTAEELKAGKAIEVVANQYKGAAAEMADVEVQLSNAWGDLKENIGRGWQNVTQPVKEFFLNVLNDINEATAKTNALKDAKNGNTSADKKLLIDAAQERVDEIQKSINDTIELLNDEEKLAELVSKSHGYDGKNNQQKKLLGLQKEYEDLTVTIQTLTEEYNNLSAAEKAEADAAAAAATAAEKEAARQKRENDAAAYKKANQEALDEQIKALQIKSAVTGKEIDQQELYNVYLNSYIDLISKSKGLVTENNDLSKQRLALLEAEAKKLKEITDEKERKAQAEKVKKEAENLLKGYTNETEYDKYEANARALLDLKTELNNAEIKEEFDKKKKIEEIDAAMARNRRELWAGMAEEINGYSDATNEIIQNAAKMALETENNRMKAELANLEIQYRKGELGEEQYQEKVAEAKKKGAKIQYQIEMAQWSANLLAATANTAVGVTQALAQGGFPAGIITGALVGAAGAVQLASIMAAKPIPHFATGGYIGGMNGASLGSDNTIIAARSGELMINAAQQRQLWDIINGAAGGMGNVNLIVKNSASNIVSTSAQIDRNKIELMIDARVDEGLKNGRFNAGLNAANASMSGDFYGL